MRRFTTCDRIPDTKNITVSPQIVHGILYGWVYGPENIFNRGPQIEIVLESFLHRDDSDWQSLIEDMFCESEPLSIEPRDVIRRVIRSFRLDKNSNWEYYINRRIVFLHALSRFSPSIPPALLGNGYGPGLMASMFRGCQQSLCPGGAKYTISTVTCCLRAYW